jgi:hypothetical protein
MPPAQQASWRAISTSLATDSEKWRSITNEARVLWIQMMLRCDNYGTIEGDDYVIWATCAKRLGFTQQQGSRAIRDLCEAGLVVCWTDDAGMDWAHMIGFDDHQPSEFIRKRGARRSSPVPDIAPEHGPASVRRVGRSQKKKEKEKKKEKNIPAGMESGEPDPVMQVFEHWVQIDTDTGGGRSAGRILTDPRRRKIRARLREGYTVGQLQQAITAFCNDPWHAGHNDRRTRYTGLETLLKSGEKVEAGLRLADQTITRRERAGEYVKPQATV